MDAVERGELPQKLRDAVETAILRGEFPPGARLDETLLAKRFGVSRTPIREALNQLVAAGLLERRPRRGVTVATVSSARLMEMFEVMAQLEGLAGKLAARRLSKADLLVLRECHEACQAASCTTPDAYYYANERFHQAIYTASHSDFLAEQCVTLSRRLRPFRRMQLEVRNRVVTSFGEHEAILAAIEEHREDDAERLLHGHVMIQNERFGDLMAVLKQSQK